MGALELLLFSHVIPELGLGNDCVLGKDSESKDSGVGISWRWVSSSENKVLSDLSQRRATFIWRLESVGS